MSSETQNIIIGVIIGALVTAFGWFLEFMSRSFKERKQREDQNRKSRRQAYSRLKAMLDGLTRVGESSTQRRVYSDQLKEFEKIISDYEDVLDDSTLEAWYSKYVSSTETKEEHAEHCIVDFGVFIDNIRWHYERFDKRSPYHNLAYTMNPAE